MKKKKIVTAQAVGTALAHDITRIVPGVFKGPAFRKGHVVRRKDIPELLKIGKEHLWVIQLAPNEFHEDEAARKFRALADRNITCRGPREGKLTFVAKRGGLLQVEQRVVHRINRIAGVVFATRHTDIPVVAGEELAGIRVIPLAVRKRTVTRVLAAARPRPLRIAPFRKARVGLIVTGSEIARGLVKDRFRPVITEKLRAYGSRITHCRMPGDDKADIVAAIGKFRKTCDMIVVTGGMSVDPDDVTRAAIRDSGARLVAYGVPVLPGNMLLLAYLGRTPVVGVPACGIFHMTTSFDLVLPQLLAGQAVTAAALARKGYGGFCCHCPSCTYPNCSLGK